MLFSEKAKDKKFWQTVREDERYKFFIDDLKKLYDEFAQGEIVDINYDAFMEYHKTGSRDLFEWDYYFPRRNRLNACALLSLIFPDNEEYFNNLNNTIWAICNEYCWSLPNHNMSSEFEYNDIFIDLFAAETGFALSEIRYLLGDRLSIIMNNRIHNEIEKRIIKSFINNKYPFETYRSNWAAVCAGSVGIAFMYERPDLFYSVKPRLDDSMNNFMQSIKADGVCREGAAYWDYGFGFYTAYAQRLLEFSKGEINLFDDEKTKKIAQFPTAMFLSGNASVSFSDGGREAHRNFGIDGLLKNHYKELIGISKKEYYTTFDHCARWAKHIESIVYFDPDIEFKDDDTEREYYMQDSAWYIKKCKEYGFAAKAGDNDEPHNHNDIGNFIFAKDSEQIFCDLGCGLYSKAYFRPETRYSILCNRSMGHNVPIIDSLEQSPGENYFGTMKKDENGIEIQLINAYKPTGVSSFVRRFTFTEKTVTLKDTFEFKSACPVTERFVSIIKPEICGDIIKIHNIFSKFDSENWQLNITEQIHDEHFGNESIPVYIMDFTPKSDKVNSFVMEINV